MLCLARQADELGLEAAALALYDEALALAFNLQGARCSLQAPFQARY